MKSIPKSSVARCLSVGAVIGLIVLAGPSLIHLAYRVTTPSSEKRAQTELYQRLANAEASDASLTDPQRMRMREGRLRLFYWFHARGWDIDEDDEDRSWLWPWKELILHWTGSQAANALLPASVAGLLSKLSVTRTGPPVATLTLAPVDGTV